MLNTRGPSRRCRAARRRRSARAPGHARALATRRRASSPARPRHRGTSRSRRGDRRHRRARPRRAGPRRGRARSRRRDTRSSRLQGNIAVVALRELIHATAPDVAADLGDPESAERTLAALCAEAAAAWPGVDVAPVEVIGLLATKLAAAVADDGDRPPLSAAALAELHLAIACARGDAAAI